MNTNSRIANSVKNISFGVTAQVIQMLLGFVSRTVFIKYLAIEYLGVNGLFTNILSLFSLAELGIGSAFLYALYKPIAAKDEKKLAALIGLYSRIYMIIAGIVTVIGLLIMPFLDIIVHDPSPKIADDLYIIYGLFLFNTVSTYFFYYKLSLFHADQKSYVVSKQHGHFYFAEHHPNCALDGVPKFYSVSRGTGFFPTFGKPCVVNFGQEILSLFGTLQTRKGG